MYKIIFFLFFNVSFYQKVNICSQYVFVNDFDFIWDVYVFVFDINCVDIYFFGDEFNVVVVVIQIDNVIEFCQVRGVGD